MLWCHIFFRNLKTDKKKHDSLEKKSKNILQEENNLKASIDHTNDHLKKLENSIKQEQKKVPFEWNCFLVSWLVCVLIVLFKFSKYKNCSYLLLLITFFLKLCIIPTIFIFFNDIFLSLFHSRIQYILSNI